MKTPFFPDKFGMLVRRIIYITGIVWLCYLDHIIGSATGYIQYALKNYTGVVIAVIVLTAYKLGDFIKLPYFLWIIVFFLGKSGVMAWAEGRIYEIERLEATLWNIGFYGMILIRIYYAWFVERKRPRMNWMVLCLWLVMMIGMVIVRTDISWPGWFLLFFCCFYLTEFSQEDLNNLYSGIVEGIILGFLLLQACACMFRPYDMLRYEGMYSNSNINALFYLLTYGAVLCKWYQMKLKRRRIWLRLPIIALTGILFSLTFFTMGRTALIAMVILTMIFLIFQALSRKKERLKIVVLDIGAVTLAVVMCFVPTYYAVRYIPAYVDRPLFFEADMNKLEKKIQKGDPIDSERYTELKTVLEKSFDRLFWFLGREENSILNRILVPTMIVQAEGWQAESVTEGSEAVPKVTSIKPGEDKSIPLFTKEEAEDPVKVRMGIYKYYIENIKWIGQREGTADLWLTSNYSAPHAHNLFLHIAGEFGWIISGLFTVMIGVTYYTILAGIVKKRQGKWYFRLFVTAIFLTVVVTFGMLEICWTFGQLPFTMFFFVQYMTVHKTLD